MSKQTKVIYRILAWFFTTVIAASTLTGCYAYGSQQSSKYGPPVYNSSTPSSTIKDQDVQVPQDK
ncbi:MAG: hypothetical protein H7Y18_17190 [Clostridiaceae bacterium]|nr:hypothetical protein [Clostridiaceae bacterium]